MIEEAWWQTGISICDKTIYNEIQLPSERIVKIEAGPDISSHEYSHREEEDALYMSFSSAPITIPAHLELNPSHHIYPHPSWHIEKSHSRSNNRPGGPAKKGKPEMKVSVSPDSLTNPILRGAFSSHHPAFLAP